MENCLFLLLLHFNRFPVDHTYTQFPFVAEQTGSRKCKRSRKYVVGLLEIWVQKGINNIYLYMKRKKNVFHSFRIE